MDDLPAAFAALAERRFDAIAVWDHVPGPPIRCIRALLASDVAGSDPLLATIAARVSGVPIAVLHAHGGYAVFLAGGAWCLSEPDGPDWTDALRGLARR